MKSDNNIFAVRMAEVIASDPLLVIDAVGGGNVRALIAQRIAEHIPAVLSGFIDGLQNPGGKRGVGKTVELLKSFYTEEHPGEQKAQLEQLSTEVTGDVREHHYKCGNGHEFSVMLNNTLEADIDTSCPVWGCEWLADLRDSNPAEISKNPVDLLPN